MYQCKFIITGLLFLVSGVWNTDAGSFYRSVSPVHPSMAEESQTTTHHLEAIPVPGTYHESDNMPKDSMHTGFAIVAPLTKLAHITYDSVPITHTPYEHVPLFQRISHVEAQAQRRY